MPSGLKVGENPAVDSKIIVAVIFVKIEQHSRNQGVAVVVQIDVIPVIAERRSGYISVLVAHSVTEVFAFVFLVFIRIVALREMCLDVVQRLACLAVHDIKVEAVVGIEVEKRQVADLECSENKVVIVFETVVV